jgi:diguanylate cyclase (GGDEF)-like protein
MKLSQLQQAVKVDVPTGNVIDVDDVDWDLLARAVTARLSSLLGTANDGDADTRSALQDCVNTLAQLHAGLAQARGRHLRIERELRDAQAKLAKARAELAGTQAGERRARHLAQHDQLTTLPNRGFFRQRLDEALAPRDAEPSGLAVMFVDLDGFKPINDRHGHATGDELLRIVAARLARSIRAEDMACRMGGDEFACLLRDVMTRERLSHLACKLFDAVSAPLKIGDLELTVRPSIGIAICPADGDNADALITRADRAMYRAKRRQLGYAFFERGSDS